MQEYILFIDDGQILLEKEKLLEKQLFTVVVVILQVSI